MKKIALIIAAAGIVGFAGAASANHGEPHSGPANPTATHDNPSSCLGAERATRNSAGGDREKGGFGPAQSGAVKANQPYGQFLQEWKSANCEHAPGQPD